MNTRQIFWFTLTLQVQSRLIIDTQKTIIHKNYKYFGNKLPLVLHLGCTYNGSE